MEPPRDRILRLTPGLHDPPTHRPPAGGGGRGGKGGSYRDTFERCTSLEIGTNTAHTHVKGKNSTEKGALRRGDGDGGGLLSRCRGALLLEWKMEASTVVLYLETLQVCYMGRLNARRSQIFTAVGLANERGMTCCREAAAAVSRRIDT